MKIIEFFELLTGSWQLERKIQPQNTYLSGQAEFIVIEPKLLHYKEFGEIHSHQYFEREYFYKLDEDSKQIDIYFDQACVNLFCIIKNIEEDNFYSQHLCGKDTYLFRILPRSEKSFDTECKVVGPKKNNVIITKYCKNL